MRNEPDRRQRRPDLAPLAEPFNHELTHENPLWVDATPNVGARSLSVHIHQGMDFGVMLSGTQELWFDDVYMQAKRGDVWFCAMWEPHAWRVPRAGAQSLLFVLLPELLESAIEHDLSLLEMFAVRASSRPRVADRQTRAEVLALAHEVSHEVLQRKPGWRMAVELGLLRLLLLLRRRWAPPAETPARPRRDTNALARIMPALALAHRDLRGRLEPGEAASACGLSRSRFNETFRSAIGLSFGQFRRRARLAYAAHRLLDTNLAVEAIAEESGFVDRSHLHHLFQSQYGCTPADYRRRARRGSRLPGAGYP